MSEPTYNKKFTKPKTLIGNWYEESVQREKDNLRKRFQEAEDSSTAFRRGKHRARYVNTTNGAIPIMRDDLDDENEKLAMTNVQSLPDFLSHYESSDRVAEAPFETTTRSNGQRVKQYVNSAVKSVPKRKLLKEEALMQEAIRQVVQEKQREALPIGEEERFQTTYKRDTCRTGEEQLSASQSLGQRDAQESGAHYAQEEPVTFYTQSVDKAPLGATAVYHTKTTGVSRFGKNAGFSQPVSEYSRGVDKE